MKRGISVLSFLLLSIQLVFAEKEWKLELDKNGIKVYTRKIEGSSFKEFKGETNITANISDIEKVIWDVENYPEWSYKTVSITIIDEDSTTIDYFYVSDTPSFLKTRVACFSFHRERNLQTGEVLFTIKDISCNKPIDDGMLLIPIMKGYWKLTPDKNGEIKVTIQMQTEAGGIIPGWLANLVVVDSPYISLKNLAIQINKKN